MHAETSVYIISKETSNPIHKMPEAEVLARASAFDPRSVDPAKVMRLALEMIVSNPEFAVEIATTALREVA